MNIFQVPALEVAQVDHPGLGLFAWLPPELRDDILYALVQGVFPFGIQRTHQALVPPRELEQEVKRKVALAGLPYRNVTTVAYMLQGLRRHVRHLMALAATSKQWYMIIRNLYPLMYPWLRAHTVVDARHENLWFLTRELSPLVAISQVKKHQGELSWMVAAVRLCLWPQGRRSFLGYSSLATLQRAYHKTLTLEEFQTALHTHGSYWANEYVHYDLVDRSPRGEFHYRRLRAAMRPSETSSLPFEAGIDSQRPLYGKNLYIRHYWQLFPNRFASIEQQEQWPLPLGPHDPVANPLPLNMLPKTVDSLMRLVEADREVVAQEEMYWAMVRGDATPPLLGWGPKQTWSSDAAVVVATNVHSRKRKRQE